MVTFYSKVYALLLYLQGTQVSLASLCLVGQECGLLVFYVSLCFDYI